MKIGIFNCDLDKSEVTNGAYILNKLIPNSEIIFIMDGINKVEIEEYVGFIITGSRANIFSEYKWINVLKSLLIDIKEKQIPVFGICFGMQLIADLFGGKVLCNNVEELGFIEVNVDNKNSLFVNLPTKFNIYEFHHDIVSKVPLGSKIIAENENGIQAFLLNNFYGVQFHPEVSYEIAKLMANRDGDDLDKILGSISENYDLNLKVIENFVNFILFEK